MQRRFPNSETVPLFYNRKNAFEPPPRKARVIARKTTFIPDGHEVVIVGRCTAHNFPSSFAGVFEPSLAFCEKYQL